MTSSMQEIDLARIRVSNTGSQAQRRKHFAKGELEDLVGSIATHGVLQPIIVRTIKRSACLNYLAADPTHELVAGERRFLAAGQAGLATIPAVVRDLTDEQVIEVQLIENLQRKDLHPMQEAEGYQELIKKHGHHVDQLHDRVGKSRSYVYGRMKLLDLCKKAREAFYADEISASHALLIARIPTEKLQQEALKDLKDYNGQLVSYRRAKEIIHDRYMLRLSEASFPRDDADLNGKAGPCTTCPKRTGNQAELFADVKSADVCTDPPCFQAKTNAWGQRLIAKAREDGRNVITGAAAKKVAPHSEYSTHLTGYRRLDEKPWHDEKKRTVRKIIGDDAEVELLQLPKTGEVIEVVKESVLDKALKRATKSSNSKNPYQDEQRQRQKKAKVEKAFRLALYAELRSKLAPASLLLIAQTLYDLVGFETIQLLCTVRSFEPPSDKHHSGKDYHAIGKTIGTMSDPELLQFINDLIYSRELHASSWSTAKPELLLAAAKKHRVDANAIRRQVTPKKKKAAKKSKARKKAKR